MFDAQEIAKAVEKLLRILSQVVEYRHENLFALEVLEVASQVHRIVAAVNQIILSLESSLEVTGNVAHFDEIEVRRKGALARFTQAHHQPCRRKIMRNSRTSQRRSKIIVTNLGDDSMLLPGAVEELEIPAPAPFIKLVEEEKLLDGRQIHLWVLLKRFVEPS
ncbi:MAG TPA: hypothetical protein VGT03_11935 [Candidatus Acidoferrales bacterium]|nr:hypothetical protein [Candidatus Acidoferrales bacterium]